MASVGIGNGKIVVSTPLERGSPKKLDPVAVYNDGDETGRFEMEVMFNETQPEHKPKADWISFSPQQFELEPGASQVVEITLMLPENAAPGEYFAYLEAHMMKKTVVDEQTQTTIGAAAASKLLFTVSEPAKQQAIVSSSGNTTPVFSPPLFVQTYSNPTTPAMAINKLMTVSPIL